ncbi:MAG: hypothetical protein JWP25_591 [Bradyrhizobium sp.]|jgi:hypothetical protein|nr:hypothetical protein [Bradyrhizobium sp.]
MKKIKNDPAEYLTRDHFAKREASEGSRGPSRLSKEQRDKVISNLGKSTDGKAMHMRFGASIRK